jgi:hypothetical protein
MAEAQSLPYHLVEDLIKPGLTCMAGKVALRSYMSKTHSNGGADNAEWLLGHLRSKKDGGVGPTLSALLGGHELDYAMKGQGRPASFVKIWDFMCRNKDLLKALKHDVYKRRDRDNPEALAVLYTGKTVHELYFQGKSDAVALQAMVDDGFFGIDCVGFCGNVLVENNEWQHYLGATPAQWPLWHCTKDVNSAAEVKPLDFLLWGDHIAMVDWVWWHDNDKTVRIDVCQSSSGGAQCNESVVLQHQPATPIGTHQRFKILHRGQPQMPVHGDVFIRRRKGFFW